MSEFIENKSVQTADIAVENNNFWSVIGEALRGSQRNLTQGSLGRAIFLLSVPMILEMMGESLFAVVDIFFVAKLGAEAVAVVGLTEAMIVIVYALAMGVSIGATATVARRIGEEVRLETTLPDGQRMRWRFLDIATDSFTWLNERETDGEWRLTQDFAARRQRR